MCLYTKNTTPLIANEDIPVIKYLEYNGKYLETPYVHVLVELNKKLIAQPETAINWRRVDTDHYGRFVYSVEDSVIHALLFSHTCNFSHCMKAIIPKGTEFWVDTLGQEIAAKEMIITSQIVNPNTWSIPKNLAQQLLHHAPKENGISVGDFQLIDNSFVPPSKNIPKNKIRGQVCGFYENKTPIICGLDKLKTIWSTSDIVLNDLSFDFLAARQILNGYKITTKYLKQFSKSIGFEAFHACATYRKEYGEEWFLGSLGELTIMLDNIIYLNMARAIIGFGDYLTNRDILWSCMEYNKYKAYCCRASWQKIRYDEYSKHCLNRVIPFFHF